jgi:hypothetical protein
MRSTTGPVDTFTPISAGCAARNAAATDLRRSEVWMKRARLAVDDFRNG